VEVTAIARNARGPSPRTRCDDDGNFCVRYLAPGTYALFIHDPSAGYCRVDDVVVPAGVIDVGERSFRRGATVAGPIHFVRPSPVPDAVVATDARGVTVTRPFEGRSSFDQVNIPGLWPGRWTIEARAGETSLARAEVDIVGEETRTVTLRVEGLPKP
jgi:hypothetical protein